MFGHDEEANCEYQRSSKGKKKLIDAQTTDACMFNFGHFTATWLAKDSFKPTTLYVKIHLVTWKRYFGKTSKFHEFDDVHKYTGSGKFWMPHLRKHGKNYITIIVGHFKDKQQCEHFALHFSSVNEIKESPDWANLVDENGLDGGDTNSGRSFPKRSAEVKQRISDKLTGRTFSMETRRKMSDAKRGRERSEHTRMKIAASLTGHIVSDETKRRMSKAKIGNVLSEETKRKIGDAHKGRKHSAESKEKMRRSAKSRRS